jgi:hypothetical protein
LPPVPAPLSFEKSEFSKLSYGAQEEIFFKRLFQRRLPGADTATLSWAESTIQETPNAANAFVSSNIIEPSSIKLSSSLLLL